MHENIIANLHTVQSQIDRTLAQKGLSQEVTLLAVSKKNSAETIISLAQAHQLHFGENTVQEAIPKILACQQAPNLDHPLIWHFIGHIQSNKTQEIATYFDWVHSVDRLTIAKRLNQARPNHLAPLNICIQVNISQDPNKGGLTPNQVSDFILAIQPLTQLRVRGIMTITALNLSESEQRMAYATMKKLMASLNDTIMLETPLDTLSMGMSQDYLIAIEEGSTLVRVGQAIFGARAST